MLKLKLVLSFAVLLFASEVFAYSGTLLKRPDRPTIADLEREFPLAQFPENPFCPRSRDYLYTEEALALYIAELEWAYPGAIYMPLGRDIVILGDALDAFYHMHGYPGRVIRLNASGQSLRGQEHLIYRWVQSSGVDFEKIKDSPGYVITDYSNYYLPHGSQSTLILTEVYNGYERAGGKREDLLTKFVFYNSHFSVSGSSVAAGGDREAFLEERRAELRQGLIPQKTFSATQQMRRDGEWHSNFLPLTEQEDGSVTAAPGALQSAVHRVKILCQMRQFIHMASRPRFLELVKKHARKLGYEFSFEPNKDCGKELKGARR